MSEIEHLRERIQAAAWSALSPWADPENDDWRDAAADQVADAVLADLGLEQVGWFYRQAHDPNHLRWCSNTSSEPSWPSVHDITPAYQGAEFDSSQHPPSDAG